MIQNSIGSKRVTTSIETMQQIEHHILCMSVCGVCVVLKFVNMLKSFFNSYYN